MSNKRKELSWTPIKSGKHYCSPACGFKCTITEYNLVVKKAKALAKKCAKEIGGNWEIKVHENLGWHYSVSLVGSSMNISYGGYRGNGGDYYSIGFNGGTPSQISLHPTTFVSPKSAFDAQTKRIEQEAKEWNDHLKMNKKALKHTLTSK